MIGFILKDFYSLRQYVKTLLFMLAFFALFSYSAENPATYFSGFMIIVTMMMTISSFSYDNLAKWDRFGLSLPVTRNEIVASKYILSLVLCLIGAVLSFFISSAILIIKPVTDFGLKENLLSIGSIMTVAIIIFSILLPLIFKFGVEKSRLFMIMLFAMPTVLILSFGRLGMSLPSEDFIIDLLKLLPFISIILLLLSFLLSCHIFAAKEI